MGAASYMVIIDTVVYFKSRCPLVIMLLEGRSVALSNILDNSWMCRKFCNQGNTLLKYFVVGNASKHNGAVVLLSRISTLSYFTWKSLDSLIKMWQSYSFSYFSGNFMRGILSFGLKRLKAIFHTHCVGELYMINLSSIEKFLSGRILLASLNFGQWFALFLSL